MKRKLTLVTATIAMLALALAWYAWGPAATPQGQPPLLALTAENLEQLRSEFNAATESARVVALLSPT